MQTIWTVRTRRGLPPLCNSSCGGAGKGHASFCDWSLLILHNAPKLGRRLSGPSRAREIWNERPSKGEPLRGTVRSCEAIDPRMTAPADGPSAGETLARAARGSRTGEPQSRRVRVDVPRGACRRVATHARRRGRGAISNSRGGCPCCRVGEHREPEAPPDFIIIASVAIPVWTARDPNPRRGLTRAVVVDRGFRPPLSARGQVSLLARAVSGRSWPFHREREDALGERRKTFDRVRTRELRSDRLPEGEGRLRFRVEIGAATQAACNGGLRLRRRSARAPGWP